MDMGLYLAFYMADRQTVIVVHGAPHHNGRREWACEGDHCVSCGAQWIRVSLLWWCRSRDGTPLLLKNHQAVVLLQRYSRYHPA